MSFTNWNETQWWSKFQRLVSKVEGDFGILRHSALNRPVYYNFRFLYLQTNGWKECLVSRFWRDVKSFSEIDSIFEEIHRFVIQIKRTADDIV